MAEAAPARLEAEGLVVRAGERAIVRGVGFELAAGDGLALVGASGSGKTMTARALLGLVRARPGVVAGAVRVQADGRTVEPYAAGRRREREARFRELRGGLLGYLPQHAAASLDPVWTVGRQLAEVIRLAGGEGEAADWLARAGLPHPRAVARRYPHELSGGMAQRVCIAQALARGSRFLVADEPTTGLDPTVQHGILRTLGALRDQGIGLLFITHDLRVVPRVADEVLVMHAGSIVDRLPANALDRARSPWSRRLVEATARIAGRRA